MPADKDAAKRRRQARNRQERLARQSRVDGAKKASSRPARTTSGRGDDGASGDAAAPATGGFLSKLFPPRPESGSDGAAGRSDRPPPLMRTPSLVVELDDPGAGAAGWLRRSMAQPGGRPVVLAFVAALASALALFILPIAPRVVQEVPARLAVEASSDDDAVRDDRLAVFDDAEPVVESARLLEVVNPAVGTLFALFPVAITATALASLTKATRGRTLLFSSLIGAMYVLFTGMFGFFLIGAGLLAFAAYKSRKADVAAFRAAEDT